MTCNNINRSNVDHVRRQIAIKNDCSRPYSATIAQSAQVLTDYDVFPYPRWYRGVPTSDKPIVAEREAGWRPRRDECYQNRMCVGEQKEYPNHYFQAPCSTVFPCCPKKLLFDREAENLLINKNCIVKYR